MVDELVSRRTRDELREFLVAHSKKREIEAAFAGAGIRHDASYLPAIQSERRLLVEQYYHSLDFATRVDILRLLNAYAAVIERAVHGLPDAFDRSDAEAAIAKLQENLEKDGFGYGNGTILPRRPELRVLLEEPRSISEVTRRAIFDELRVGQCRWAGELDEDEFLARAGYDLTKLPSRDRRYPDMSADLWQHRVNNHDWDDYWVFTDERIDLLGATDQMFLRFLIETVHPAVRPNTDQAHELVVLYNGHLEVDGWEIIEGRAISGKPTFLARTRATSTVILPEAVHANDVLSNEYVRELSGKCDARLLSGDLDGAVTVARTLLEMVLSQLELRLAGAAGEYKGDLSKQFKQVARLLRMDAERPDLDDRFKDVIRGLVMIANGIAPLRNKLSDGHPRVRKPALHHARVVVNAARTVSSFLVESYSYQRDRGLVHDVPPKTELGKAKPRH